jgi:hypothetical protein
MYTKTTESNNANKRLSIDSFRFSSSPVTGDGIIEEALYPDSNANIMGYPVSDLPVSISETILLCGFGYDGISLWVPASR